MALKFKEKIPDGCPLPDSKDVALADVWRFLRKMAPTEDCFASHAARNRENKRNACECGWASCSFYIGDKLTKDMMKLPMFKNFIARAEMLIPEGSGMSIKKGDHVDFWAYDHFSFTSAIVRIEPK